MTDPAHQPWHAWFAWYPVRTIQGRWAWCQTVERAGYAHPDVSGYDLHVSYAVLPTSYVYRDPPTYREAMI